MQTNKCLYYCKLFPIFTSLHTLLTIIILFCKNRSDNKLLKVVSVFKVTSRFSKITRRWRGCWSRSVCQTFVSIRLYNVFVCLPFVLVPVRVQCVVCKTNWIKIIIFMSWNVNNWSLAPQLKEIFSYSNPNISLDQHSTRAVKKWWLGGDHAHLKGLETRDWWLISSYTHRFCF